MQNTIHKPVKDELELVVPTEQQKRAQRNRSWGWPSLWHCSCCSFTLER